MKTDVTLYEIYRELGLLRIMQSVAAAEFVTAACEDAADVQESKAA